MKVSQAFQIGVCAVSTMCCSIAVGQTEASGSSATGDQREGGALTEIVVTATRRSASLQDVPITVSAVSGEQLLASGVATTRGLEQVVPGLVIAQNGPAAQPTLRGVGTRSSGPGDESNVAMYLDGVYQPAMSSNNFELLNVERVEVLKGPQGTLFGRNATGGAINVITTKPSQETAARVSLEYGRFDQIKAATYLTMPLTETLSADLALQYDANDGYIDDAIRGGKLGERRGRTARGRLRWQPNDAVDIIAAVSGTDVDDNSAFVTQPIDGNSIGRRLDPSVLLPSKTRQFVGEIEPVFKTQQWDVNLQAAFDLGAVSLETTTDYQENSAEFRSDSDSTTVNRGSQASPDNYMDAWSQEVRLISQTGERFDWVAGALAFGSKGQLNPLFSSNGTTTTIVAGKQKTRAYAGFAEGNYELLDGLYLTGGLRYSWEKKTFYPFINAPQPEVDETFTSWTPRASIRYEFTPGSSVYFTYSQGFKSGMFNATSTQRTPVDPEKIKAYEVGLKLQPTAWLRANLSAFHYDYTDLQVQSRDVNSASVIFQNAGGAKLKGFNADVTLAPVRGLNISAGLEILDTRYTKFPLAQVIEPATLNGVPIGGNNTIFTDVSGNELLRAPDWTMTAGISYEFDAAGGLIKLGVNGNYNDGYWHEVGNRLRQPAYTLVNATVGWWTNDERFGVTVWGENLADEDIALYPIISGNGDNFSFRKPMTYGIRLSGRF